MIFFRFALAYFTENDPYAMQANNPQIRSKFIQHLTLKDKKNDRTNLKDHF